MLLLTLSIFASFSVNVGTDSCFCEYQIKCLKLRAILDEKYLSLNLDPRVIPRMLRRVRRQAAVPLSCQVFPRGACNHGGEQPVYSECFLSSVPLNQVVKVLSLICRG